VTHAVDRSKIVVAAAGNRREVSVCIRVGQCRSCGALVRRQLLAELDVAQGGKADVLAAVDGFQVDIGVAVVLQEDSIV
jgi:hypothetical protein